MSLERGSQLVQVLSCVLSRLVATNDANPVPGQRVTKFHAYTPPGISLKDYLSRIYRYAVCSSECFVLALVYIDRLIQRNNVILNSLNVHRIIITSLMLAAKFFDDQYFNNAYYSKVGGVPCSEMNCLELEFLFSINFSLHVPTDVYEKYNMELVNHVATPSVPCECPGIFRAHGVVLEMPKIPPALPSPEVPREPRAPLPASAHPYVPPMPAAAFGGAAGAAPVVAAIPAAGAVPGAGAPAAGVPAGAGAGVPMGVPVAAAAGYGVPGGMAPPSASVSSVGAVHAPHGAHPVAAGPSLQENDDDGDVGM